VVVPDRCGWRGLHGGLVLESSPATPQRYATSQAAPDNRRLLGVPLRRSSSRRHHHSLALTQGQPHTLETSRDYRELLIEPIMHTGTRRRGRDFRALTSDDVPSLETGTSLQPTALDPDRYIGPPANPALDATARSPSLGPRGLTQGYSRPRRPRNVSGPACGGTVLLAPSLQRPPSASRGSETSWSPLTGPLRSPKNFPP
jgi:hypothetical protein